MSLDMVVLRLREERLELLLETRDRPPFAHCWQLPALRIDETRDRDLDAARHRLLAQWGLAQCYSEQVCTLGNLERDPRGWSTTLVYLCLAEPEAGAVRGCWHPLDDLPGLQLAFDHPQLIAMGLERLRIQPQALQLLEGHDWPGNVRELEHAIHRAAVLARAEQGSPSPTLAPHHFNLGGTGSPPPVGAVSQAASPVIAGLGLRAATDLFQRQLIEQTLTAHQGNWAATARALDLDGGNLHRLARRLGLKE